MFTDIDTPIEIDGFTLTARILADSNYGAPWEEHDGHGPVSGMELRDKRPGELVLHDNGHGRKRYYDYQEACRIARRELWDAAPYNTGQETKRQQAAKAARANYERLRQWCDDQWHWCGVLVVASKNGIDLGRASLWGIESDAGDYLLEVANELVEEALEDARDTVCALAA